MSAVKSEENLLRVAGLNRKELLEILQGTHAWEESMQYWTKPELNALVLQLRGSRNTGTAVDQELKRVSKMKKAEIQATVQEAGLEITGQETIGQMLIAYRKHLKSTLPVEANQLVEFGTHKGKTFAEVQTKFPDYCVWARDLFHQNQDTCCPGMVRLVCWLEGLHPGTLNTGREDTPPRPSRASGSGAQPKHQGAPPRQTVKEEPRENSPRLRHKAGR